MRTPNCACLVCSKPMYRRPYELKKYRHVACMDHRAIAQKLSGITDAQQSGLSLGREKGTNHRVGYKHLESSKIKASLSHKKWAQNNPERIVLRGLKSRGENHYRWNGGISRLNTSIRTMHENRKWADAVRARDKYCLRCGSENKLEAHHKKHLSHLIEYLGVTNRNEARKFAVILWDLNNGETLCKKCHWLEHGRIYDDNR